MRNMQTEKIAIVTDNACDASDAELAEIGVKCVHLGSSSLTDAFPRG